MTDGLPEWLRAQFDEDERLARTAANGGSGKWFVGDKWNVYRVEDETPNEDAETNELVVYGNVKAQSEHIAAHDPARVLREIDAKRAIVARYEFACQQAGDLSLAEEERDSWVKVAGALQSCVLCLAVIYADRPGYDEAWRP